MPRPGTVGFGVTDPAAVAAGEIAGVSAGLDVTLGVGWVGDGGRAGPAHAARARLAIARTVAARVRMLGGLIA